MAKLTFADGLRTIVCPRCGNDSTLNVQILCDLTFGSDPNGVVSDSYYADGDSYCLCMECEFEGRVREFTK